MNSAKLTLSFAVVIACALSPNWVQASPQLEMAKVCLQDSTSGKDRKILVRWIFTALSSNPDLQEFSPSKEREAIINREAADLFQRLMVRDCLAELRQLGSTGIEEAFNNLGQIAAKEMMQNKAFEKRMEKFGKTLDTKELERAYK